MINLLPKDQKNSIKFARRNVKLMHWSFGMLGIIAIMIALWGAGYFYLNSTIANYSRGVEQKRNDLKAQKLEETQTRVENLSNNLKLILQVLSKEVLFSKLLQQIGSVMPDGSVLSAIDISKVEGGLDLVATAKDYDTATQIQVNLQDKDKKLFQKVDIVSVSCDEGPATSSTTTTQDVTENKYPCTVSLRALFGDKNPFLFINKSASEN
jgi:hypothetical protein